MKHYDQFEWKLYKSDLLDDYIKEEMRIHLLNCDKCLDSFISLIDEEEVRKVENRIPEDFTVNLMDKIDRLEKQEIEIRKNNIIEFKEKQKEKKKRIFIQYVAVASITIVMTASGLFDRVAASSMYIEQPIKEEISIAGKLYELSEYLVNDFSRSLDNFNINNIFNK